MIICDAEAIDRVISRVRPVMYLEPLLLKKECKKSKAVSGRLAAKQERERRGIRRELYEELSCHYLRTKAGKWSTVELLFNGKQGCI